MWGKWLNSSSKLRDTVLTNQRWHVSAGFIRKDLTVGGASGLISEDLAVGGASGSIREDITVGGASGFIRGPFFFSFYNFVSTAL